MAKKPSKTKPAKKQAPVAKKKAAKPAAAKSKKNNSTASKSKSVKPAKKLVSKSKPAVKAKSAVKAKTNTKTVAKAKPVVKAKPAAKSKPVAKKPVGKVKPVTKGKATARVQSPAVKKTVAKVKSSAKPVSKPKPEQKKTKAPKELTSKTKAQAVPKIEVKKSAPEINKKSVQAAKTQPIQKAEKPAPVASKEKDLGKSDIKPAVVDDKKGKSEAAPVADIKKEAVKTVEQQFAEKQEMTTTAAKAGKAKEELFVPKYQLPAPVEVVRPMRPKPPTVLEDAPQKPVANPIYVPPAPDGKPGIKFAPIAIVEKPKEKTNKSEEEDMSSKASPRLAFNESDDKKGISVEAKLRALYGIQLIDSRIDKIHAMRGELPLEVQDLEDDVAGFQERIKNLNEDVKNLNEEIVGKKNGIKNSEALIKKYKEQLDNVKNNREFDSLNKEIEYQELEIQLHNKKIREFEMALNAKKDVLAATDVKLQDRSNDLSLKRAELNDIVTSTEKEEKLLRKKSDEAKKLIEERLLSAYERIRSGAPNGMAVVPIEREASAGSFIQLPPQKQLDVAARKRVIVDEHSGRILVDADLAREEQEKMDALLASELK